MNRLSLTLCAICSLALSAAATTFKFSEPHGTWWQSPTVPSLSITALNNDNAPEQCSVTLKVATDKHVPVYEFTQTATIGAGDSATLAFSFNLQPGFYNCTYTVADTVIGKYNIGYEPERIVSPADYQPDFVEFWTRARADLDSVAPEFRIERFPEHDSKTRIAYKVFMKSVCGEEISGFLITPKKKGKYPAIISYMGYGSGPAFIPTDMYPDFIYFQLSVRGQGMNIDKNTHGDWIKENLNDTEKYYYRNAFMDAVRGIDFLYQYPQFDGKNLFAMGGSQGGALTLAATALDSRIIAAAPYIPFLSDYPDYFVIAPWPGNGVIETAHTLGMTDKQLYKNLSYFDIKNLCTLIKVPVYMGVGLQDHVCPPHTNFSGYNLIKSPKHFVIYPRQAHGVDRPHWDNTMIEFFKENMK